MGLINHYKASGLNIYLQKMYLNALLHFYFRVDVEQWERQSQNYSYWNQIHEKNSKIGLDGLEEKMKIY